MSSEMLHEPAEKLSAATIDRHGAIVSLMEELEAIDWYDQRIEAASDKELQEIFRHNRDEEKEHAAWSWNGCVAMTLPSTSSSASISSARATF